MNFSKVLVFTVPRSSGPENDVRNCKRGLSGGAGKKTGFSCCGWILADLHPVKRHIAKIKVIYANLLVNTDLCVIMTIISAIFRG
jgi:hypothetical protein